MQILPVWFIFVAAAIRVFGGMAYFRATLAGKAHPHATSWLLWSFTPLITFFAELSAGVGIISVIALALGISPLLVVIAAFKTNRHLFQINRFDMVCISIAIFGLFLWTATKEPITAIIVAIIADAISSLPTIRKTIRYPHSEYAPTYLVSASSMILALLATRDISFEAFAFPTYVLTINLIIASLALRIHRKKN